ncbi:uncharacterized protein LOC125240923 [Leguminivora glycinivorella]|uniref:uncharacterized protein LOC125240923 n=1 Tax=Leguminivora glycinivorella TaxID=1035111 RepID=UPI00200F69B4|nr:uncharacterized protein LOC125240923 [Leguminivora glycinivorella]
MSIMLEPDEVDDGYFTPVASTTLASIFKEDSGNDIAVNPSLKYKPPQPKKTEESSKPDDSIASQCVFSCSIIAYEWVQRSHKCKGKVGFAMMKIVKSGMCKMILYSPDKSTLSCTTVTPHLEVTMSSGAMISYYDDNKKYWGLCFNDKNIERIKELLYKEHVIIKPYCSEINTEVEILESDEATDETGDSSAIEDSPIKPTTSQIDKASILNRIANVGHAILPSLPGSPIKKTSSVEITNTPDLQKLSLADQSKVLPEVSIRREHENISNPVINKSIAVQASQNNVETNNIFPNSRSECGQTTVTSVPLVNNQIFTYVNGYMVPLHMQVPVLDNINGADTSTEIELIIHKLTHLKTVVRTMETKQSQNFEKSQSDQLFKKISELEQLVREKDETINHLENAKQELADHVNNLNEQIQKSNYDLEKNTRIPNEELLNRKVKTLMNNTFHSLASNFDNEVNYTGNYVKGILAAVIKKITIDSLVNLFPNEASVSKKGDD